MYRLETIVDNGSPLGRQAAINFYPTLKECNDHVLDLGNNLLRFNYWIECAIAYNDETGTKDVIIDIFSEQGTRFDYLQKDYDSVLNYKLEHPQQTDLEIAEGAKFKLTDR